jgi:hypothetical protein
MDGKLIGKVNLNLNRRKTWIKAQLKCLLEAVIILSKQAALKPMGTPQSSRARSVSSYARAFPLPFSVAEQAA